MRCGIRDVVKAPGVLGSRESLGLTATYMFLDWDFNRCPLDARLVSRTCLLPSWECLSYTDRYDEALIQLSKLKVKT